MGKVHDDIKNWLIELGRANGYDAWTPDENNNVEFSKIRKFKIDYRPDVVWRSKLTKGKAFFELAFQEDLRQVIGEVFLASLVDGYVKVFIIRSTKDENYWKNVEH